MHTTYNTYLQHIPATHTLTEVVAALGFFVLFLSSFFFVAIGLYVLLCPLPFFFIL